MSTDRPRRLHRDTELEAVGYLRVSQAIQAEGYSPEIQRSALQALAAREGYVLPEERIYEDHERGSKVTRAGYQRLLAVVRRGEAAAVLVFMFDRWGRDGGEWITRARELERLGVPLISAQEGRDEGGLVRFVRAGMAEQFSRDLAKRMKAVMERTARSGIHYGRTPYGYVRVYPGRDARGRVLPGRLEIDAATAWVVREMFRRYAAGGETVISLVQWLNSDPRVPPPMKAAAWSRPTVADMLKRPVYIGHLRYNHRPSGDYERARPADMFIVEDTHPALVDQETWDRVQARLRAATQTPSANRTHTPRGKETSLLVGMLRCPDCGGGTSMLRDRVHQKTPQYRCSNRINGRTACTSPSIKASVVEAAVLAAVSRLQGVPWDADAARRLLHGPAARPGAAQAEATARALAGERERLRRLTRRMADEDAELLPEERTAFREVRTEIATRIRSLEAQLSGVQERAVSLPGLRALHAELMRVPVAGLVQTLRAEGGTLALRAFLQTLISHTHVVERRPDYRPAWVRVDVTWTDDVQTLLDAGLLKEAPPDPAPTFPTPQEYRTMRWQRLCERRKRERAAAHTQDVT